MRQKHAHVAGSDNSDMPIRNVEEKPVMERMQWELRAAQMWCRNTTSFFI